jgi:hypothetical protein
LCFSSCLRWETDKYICTKLSLELGKENFLDLEFSFDLCSISQAVNIHTKTHVPSLTEDTRLKAYRGCLLMAELR